jgi:hypothetical protein
MIAPQELAHIRQTVGAAARAAFTAVREAHPEEDFYYYVLWTTGVVHRPAPCACSKQGLARAMEKYRESEPAHLRWSEADSPYDCFGDEHFLEVERLFRRYGDPYDRADEDTDVLFSAIVGAMQDLDSDGFFGEARERESVVINVTIPGEEDEVRLLDRAKLLNPRASLRTLLRDYANSEQSHRADGDNVGG